MNNKKTLVLALIAAFLSSCSSKTDSVVKQPGNEESPVSQNEKDENEIEFRNVKIDCYFPSDDGDFANFDYEDRFVYPIIVRTKEGRDGLKDTHPEFYKARKEYLEQIDLDSKYILLFTKNTSGAYYDFVPRKITLSNGEMTITYTMDGEKEGILHNLELLYMHAIIEIPQIQEDISEISFFSTTRQEIVGLCDRVEYI